MKYICIIICSLFIILTTSCVSNTQSINSQDIKQLQFYWNTIQKQYTEYIINDKTLTTRTRTTKLTFIKNFTDIINKYK